MTGKRNNFLHSLPGVLIIVAAYALVHVTARLLASGNLGEDDPFDNLLIQTLAPGYGILKGPLYDWALWLLQRPLGTGIHAFLLLKYGLLIAMAGFLFLAARRVTGSALWAFLAVDAMALVYQIFWRFHEGFTHRAGAMALAVASLWALLRLVERGRRRDYALFALCAGLGLLTEHAYGIFLIALFAAARLQPALRVRVYARPMLAALPIALLILAPYAAWLLVEPGRGLAFLAALLPFPAEYTLAGLVDGLRDALTFPVMVLSPYIFILPLVFPGMLRTIARHSPVRPHAGPEPDLSQFILHVLLIELAWLVVFDGLVFQHSDYAVHTLLPMFMVAIVWLTDKVRQSAPSPARLRAFLAIMLTLTVVAFIGRAANMFVLDPVCSKCRWGIPYGQLAERMRAAGFEDGTIVVDEEELGGNLRRFFPETRIVLTDKGGIVPPETARSRAGRTVLVWLVKKDDLDVPVKLHGYLPADPRTWRPQLIRVPWHHLWKPDGYRCSTWAILILPAPATPDPTRRAERTRPCSACACSAGTTSRFCRTASRPTAGQPGGRASRHAQGCLRGDFAVS
ncbi:MAG: glycosyltransferase family 39 protein [Thiobacillus sp.]|nr:glycosyltransferase family 39 protein [Thiobacillus sp.]